VAKILTACFFPYNVVYVRHIQKVRTDCV